MAPKWIRKATGQWEQKRRWRQYRARSKQLPTSYRIGLQGVERYLMTAGSWSGDMVMFEDLLDLFEQSAANGTPIREIVGAEPVAFVEDFVSNYPEGDWRIRERERLIDAIERAAGEVPR